MTATAPTVLPRLAALLDDAQRSVSAVSQLSAEHALNVGDAYAIQARLIEHRVARGECVIGVKLGFTSRSKALQMGVHDVIFGRLTDRMLIEDGGAVDLSRFVHPRIEPEVAFLLGRPLRGGGSGEHALGALEAVAPAMELIDSRYRDFRFNLADVVADNCSSAGLVLGPWRRCELDLDNRGVLLELDGRPVQIGSTSAILGHPLRALTTAARLAEAVGLELQPGWIVLAGAATAAEALRPGVHVRTVIEGLGSVSAVIGAGESQDGKQTAG